MPAVDGFLGELATEAKASGRLGFETLHGDLATAFRAGAIGARRDPPQGELDRLQTIENFVFGIFGGNIPGLGSLMGFSIK